MQQGTPKQPLEEVAAYYNDRARNLIRAERLRLVTVL
jgi:hypothetical protein